MVRQKTCRNAKFLRSLGAHGVYEQNGAVFTATRRATRPGGRLFVKGVRVLLLFYVLSRAIARKEETRAHPFVADVLLLRRYSGALTLSVRVSPFSS